MQQNNVRFLHVPGTVICIYLGKDHLGVNVLNQVGFHFLIKRDKKVSLSFDKILAGEWLIYVHGYMCVSRKVPQTVTEEYLEEDRLFLVKMDTHHLCEECKDTN